MTILRAVWDSGPVTLGEVARHLESTTGMTYSTIQTYLRRLEAKGYIQSKTQGRKNVYSPRRARAKVVSQSIRDFVGRLFGGNSVPLVKHLLETGDVSPEELHEIRKLLDEAGKERKK